MGADRGIHIEASHDIEPLAVAKLLKEVVTRENPGLVFVGKQAIDDDCNQTGQMLAALLGWAQGTFVSGIEISGDKATVIREVDGGLEHLAISMPAVVTVDLRLNEPRYASLPNIMKAKKKPLDSISVEELGVDVSPRLTVVKVEEPEARSAGIKVADVSELVNKLKNEAKVI
jgi:electron transfer flavoprotein beta subunit